MSVHTEMPTWGVHERDAYHDSLWALTASHLSCAVLAINGSPVHPRTKCNFLEVILEDFLHECIQFWDIPSESSPSCLIIMTSSHNILNHDMDHLSRARCAIFAYPHISEA